MASLEAHQFNETLLAVDGFEVRSVLAEHSQQKLGPT
eukprot:gene9969-1076_t